MKDSDNWKWWYFVLAGIGIGAYSVYQAYNSFSIRPLGELILAALCIGFGLVSRSRESMQK